jgi:hypothetical protein
MKYAVEMGSSATIFILYKKIRPGIQKLMGRREFTDTPRGNRINLL